MHFNIQPVGHLIVLQSRREENKTNCKSSLCQVNAGNHHCIPGRAFYKGWARQESRGKPQETKTAGAKHREPLQVLPAHPAPDLQPCPQDSPHRHLSTVCTKVRVTDAVSNLEKGSGLQASLSTARREAAWLWELCLASILQPTGLLQQEMGEITTGLHLASNTSSCTQLQLFRKELCGNIPPPHTETIHPENPCTAATGSYRQSIGRSS